MKAPTQLQAFLPTKALRKESAVQSGRCGAQDDLLFAALMLLDPFCLLGCAEVRALVQQLVGETVAAYSFLDIRQELWGSP